MAHDFAKNKKEITPSEGKKAIKPSEGDVKYVYTNILSHSLSALSSVLRVSSNDLRFWASDYIYSDVSNPFAENDVRQMCKHIISAPADAIFLLEIEKQSGVDKLWSQIDTARTSPKK